MVCGAGRNYESVLRSMILSRASWPLPSGMRPSRMSENQPFHLVVDELVPLPRPAPPGNPNWPDRETMVPPIVVMMFAGKGRMTSSR